MLVHVPRKVDCPCCANCAINNTNTNNELDIKNAVDMNFYVDSFLKSWSNVADLIKLSKRVLTFLQPHGFCQRKWISNSPENLHFLPTSEISTNIIGLDLNTPTVERAPEMIWNINQGTLTFMPAT